MSASTKLLNDALQMLDDRVARKLALKALRKAGRVIVKEARLRAPKRTGRLKKSIRLRSKKRRKRGSPAVVVGATTDAPYAHLVERGHVQVVGTGDNKREIGFVPARPFLRPAFDTKRDEFTRRLGDELGELILAEARKISGLAPLQRAPRPKRVGGCHAHRKKATVVCAV